VQLKNMPKGFETVVVHAKDEANAWDAFKKRTGVRTTDHEPKISPYKADGE
jgi:hypothetical protein